MSPKQVTSPKIPKLRFQEFQGEWEEKPLSNFLFETKKRNKGLIYSKSEVLSVSGEKGIINQIEHLGRSYAGISVENYHVVDRGNIVYTKSPLKDNPYGIIKLNKGKPGIVSTLYAVYGVNPKKADGVFIDHYFSSDIKLNNYLKPLIRKGAKNDMKINNLYVLHDSVCFPSLYEQQKIASFLSTIDEKIEKLKTKKSLLEKYKKGVMQKIFSREMRFRDENGEEFGEWKEKKLGEIGKFSKGKGISKSDIDKNGTTECIRYGELYTTYRETISVVKSKTNIDASDLVLSEENDVIIPASGETEIDIATASCVLRSGIALGGDLNILKTKLNGIFLSYYLNNAKKYEIANMAQGISVVHLYASQLQNLEIEIPSLPEQTKIASFLSELDTKINTIQSEIENTEKWKKGLLQQMFV